MQTAPQGFFNGTNGMDASSKLPYFPAGFIGTCQVDTVKGITARDGNRAYIVELSILSSNMPDKVFVGGRYSWYQGLKEAGTAYPACIAFLLAAMGYEATRDKAKIETEVKPKQDWLLNASLSETPVPANVQLGVAALPAQFLKGAKINLQTSEKATKAFKHLPIEEARKQKGGVFTIHTFAPGSAA